MKTKTIFITCFGLLATLLLVFQSCDKEEASNLSPTCEILIPLNGQEISQGSIVNVSIGAEDSDGSISEVTFMVDGVIIGSLVSTPYVFSWNTTGVSEGNHTLVATCTDNMGKSASSEISVIIVINGSAPIANFIANTTNGTAPLTVNFTDQSTNNPTSWQWTSGDGESSTIQNPVFNYELAGTYTVSLTVTNAYGSSTETKTDYITVSNGGVTGTITDLRDGQIYNTIVIGSQTWLAENLNYETSNSWWYDNSIANGDVYGRLYTWDAAMNGEASSITVPSGVQGVCPQDWHLPSDEEWKVLEMALGMSQSDADNIGWRGTDEGGKMKETGTTHWHSPNTGATNSSGFTALAGGNYSSGSFDYLSIHGQWWSSTENTGSHACGRGLLNAFSNVFRSGYGKTTGFGVRCIKD